jgi:hypothetical protein
MGRKRKKKIPEWHAALRTVQRYEGVEYDDVADALAVGHFTYMHRQSCSRSLVKIDVDDMVIYAVINRKNRSIVTVLSPEQAAEWRDDDKTQTTQAEGTAG